MKTRELLRGAIEHLLLIGYTTEESMSDLEDSPYLIFTDKEIICCYSKKQFSDDGGLLKTQEQILKLRPEKENKNLSKRHKDIYKLLTILNSQKNRKLTGYDVSWTIQEAKLNKGGFEILPNSPFACGSIPIQHIEVILDFSKKYSHLLIAFSYTSYNNETERYGTCTPCIEIS